MRKLLFLLCLWLVPFVGAEDRPNFIFFITDDVGWNDLGCYGNKVIKTPNLDAMAERGMRFTNAYLTISSCSPSRCSIITGRYPHNTGAPELHTELPEDQYPFPLALKEAGYYTMLSGKHHMGKSVDRGFDLVSKGKGASKSEDWVDLLKGRPQDKPFFAWFASSDAHRKWDIDETNPIYNPDEIEVPPFLYDGPKTRQDLADYYHEVSRTDTTMGKLVAELKSQGIEDNTYIIYMADNGRPFPRCKTRLYDSGVKTPFLVACPGKIQPAVSDSLVSSIDIAPTILELAGVPKKETMQGVSFLPILRNPRAVVREVTFSEQNWHVFRAHQRMVRTGEFIYIRNAFPELLAVNMESDATFPAGEELWEKEAAGELNEHQVDIFQQPRPEEELYHVTDDPFQLKNLAGREEVTETMKKMRRLLDQWSEETGDTVPENPTGDRQTLDGVKDPDFEHLEFPGRSKNAEKINNSGPISGF